MLVSHMTQQVIVTGATSGIGRATALRFAREGHRSSPLAGMMARSADVATAIEPEGGKGAAFWPM